MPSKVLALLAVCSLGPGCTVNNVNRFRVVDATDSHPLEGVHATGSKGIWELSPVLGWPVYCRFPDGHATSDAAGLVQFGGSGETDATFEKQGYQPCEVVSGWPGYRPRNWLQRLHVFGWEDEATAVIRLQPCKHE